MIKYMHSCEYHPLCDAMGPMMQLTRLATSVDGHKYPVGWTFFIVSKSDTTISALSPGYNIVAEFSTVDEHSKPTTPCPPLNTSTWGL